VTHDPFSARQVIDTPLGERVVYRIDALADIGDVNSLPYSIKVLLESVLRNHDGRVIRDERTNRLESCCRISRECPPSWI